MIPSPGDLLAHRNNDGSDGLLRLYVGTIVDKSVVGHHVFHKVLLQVRGAWASWTYTKTDIERIMAEGTWRVIS